MKEYQVNWSWNKQTDVWLRTKVKGFTLNICCGKSKVGNVKADIDKSVKPDIVCDVKHLPFRLLCFDTIVCDPPFSMYNRFKWMKHFNKYARKRVIMSSPLLKLLLSKAWLRSYYITEQGGFFLRFWTFFDRNMLEF